MRIYKWLFISASLALVISLLSFLLPSAQTTVATGPEVCDLIQCSKTDTTIDDFQAGQFDYTSLNNVTGDGAVQLRPIGLTSPWITDTFQINENRAELAAVIYNDVIYVIGGLSDLIGGDRHPLNTIIRATVNPDGSIKSPGWQPITPNLPVGLSGMTAVISPASGGAWIYVLGGDSEDQFKNPALNPNIYYNFIDANTGNFTLSWQVAGQLPNYGVGSLVYYQAVVHNGYLYVMGGIDRAQGSTAVYKNIERAAIISNGTLGSWTSESNFPTFDRFMFGAVTWQGPSNDFLYLIGGSTDANNYAATAQVDRATFNPSDGSLSTFTNSGLALPSAYYGIGAVQSGNVIYVTGGSVDGQAGTSITNTVLAAMINSDGSLHQFGNDVWLPSNALPEGRRNHATVVSRYGEVYVIGGYSPNSTSSSTNTVFRGSTSGFGSRYAPSGTYTSAPISKPPTQAEQFIVVNTTITGTAQMTLQYKYQPSGGSWSNWINLPSLPTGVNQVTTVPITQPVNASAIQYRALMTAGNNNTVTPALNEFKIIYDPPTNPPDFVANGMIAPPISNTLQSTRIITYYVSNLKSGSAPQRAGASQNQPVIRPKPDKLSPVPLINGRAPSVGAAQTYINIAFYYNRDQSSPPVNAKDLNNQIYCIDANSSHGNQTTYPYVLVAELGKSYLAFYAQCFNIQANATNFWVQVDACVDPQMTSCTNNGFFNETNERNNIAGPVPAGFSMLDGILYGGGGAGAGGGPYLPFISRGQ